MSKAPTEEQLREVDERLLAGNVIEAIRMVRGYIGWDLKQAKDFVDSQQERLQREHVAWSGLAKLISYQDAEILEYPSEKGLPGYVVFWFFAFVLHDRKRRRCVVLTGSSSD